MEQASAAPAKVPSQPADLYSKWDWDNAGSTTLNVPGVFRFFATGTADYAVGGSSVQTLNDGTFYLTGGLMDWEGSTLLI